MEFRDFCLAYEERPVLSHIDLTIDAGDSIVLVGDNGPGKSTLLKAMCGLIYPQEGSYLFDGKVVDGASMSDPAFSKSLHQRVGFIFQDSDSQLFLRKRRGRNRLWSAPDAVQRGRGEPPRR